MSLKPTKFSDRGKKWAQRQYAGSAQQVLEERRKILVVTQDGKSSHYYFRAWQRRFAKGSVYFSVVSSVHTPMQIVSGLPKLRQHQEAKIAKAKKVAVFHFDEVWVAFDRDSFPDFDAAVYALRRMSAQGYREAWSNECFELWYLLHDQPIWNPAGFSRAVLFSLCAAKFGIMNRYGVSDYTKLKGKQGVELHEEMANESPAGILTAIRNAETVERQTLSGHGGPSAQPSLLNPLTRVHDLIRRFTTQSPEFLNAR